MQHNSGTVFIVDSPSSTDNKQCVLGCQCSRDVCSTVGYQLCPVVIFMLATSSQEPTAQHTVNT